MRFMLLTEKQDAISALTEQGGLGWMTIGKWQAFHDSLVENGALANPIDVNLAFTDQFLKEIYSDGELKWP